MESGTDCNQGLGKHTNLIFPRKASASRGSSEAGGQETQNNQPLLQPNNAIKCLSKEKVKRRETRETPEQTDPGQEPQGGTVGLLLGG